MVKTVYVSNEAELRESLVGGHSVTVIKADYRPAIFSEYTINYSFEEEPSSMAHAPSNFYCLRHVFHPFNYPIIIDDRGSHYRILIEKIIFGHEVRVELSLENLRLLRLCQCLLGAAYLFYIKGDSDADCYCSYRDKKGTLPVPYVNGKCSDHGKLIPAWSYYWDISDREFWADIENKLSESIAPFKKVLISKDDENDIWMFFNSIAAPVFGTGSDIETKRVTGPGYLDNGKWNEMLSDLVNKIQLFKHQKKNGASLYKTVISAFRSAFYAGTYSQAPDPFDLPNTGYSQMPDVTITDLAIPCGAAVECRFGIARYDAYKMNKRQKELTKELCNLTVYTEFDPPAVDSYTTDGYGNIIAFKQQLGDGVIIIYPHGQEDCITKLSGNLDEVEATQASPETHPVVNADSENKKEVAKSPVSVTIDITEVNASEVNASEVNIETKLEATGEIKSRSIDFNKICMLLVIYYYSVTGNGIGFISKAFRKTRCIPLVGYKKDEKNEKNEKKIAVSLEIYPIKASTEYSQHFNRLLREILTGKVAKDSDIGTKLKNDELLNKIWITSSHKGRYEEANYSRGKLSSLKINIKNAADAEQLKQRIAQVFDKTQTQLDAFFSEMCKNDFNK